MRLQLVPPKNSTTHIPLFLACDHSRSLCGVPILSTRGRGGDSSSGTCHCFQSHTDNNLSYYNIKLVCLYNCSCVCVPLCVDIHVCIHFCEHGFQTHCLFRICLCAATCMSTLGLGSVYPITPKKGSRALSHSSSIDRLSGTFMASLEDSKYQCPKVSIQRQCWKWAVLVQNTLEH